jgi:hypothetical protein
MAFNKDKDNAASSIMEKEMARDKEKNNEVAIKESQKEAETEKEPVKVESTNPDAEYPKMDDPGNPAEKEMKSLQDVFNETKGRSINSIEDLKDIYRKVQELILC